jgi:hemoglobin-like flavoprotein
MNMRSDQRVLVKKTWTAILPTADSAASLFYQKLFEIDPEARKLFQHIDMCGYKRRLIEAFSYVVDGLDQPDRLISTDEVIE